jgi:hypothetical protein
LGKRKYGEEGVKFFNTPKNGEVFVGMMAFNDYRVQ